jgi:hypothetical protein
MMASDCQDLLRFNGKAATNCRKVAGFFFGVELELRRQSAQIRQNEL